MTTLCRESQPKIEVLFYAEAGVPYTVIVEALNLVDDGGQAVITNFTQELGKYTLPEIMQYFNLFKCGCIIVLQ